MAGRETATVVSRLGLASLGGLWGALLLSLLALGAVVLIALRFRQPLAHCGQGLISLGPTCCVAGQTLEQGRCIGAVETCPPTMQWVEGPRPGCVVDNHIVHFEAGELDLGPMDWEAQGVVAARRVAVRAFSMDALEVSVARWHECVVAKSCDQLPGELEPGLPVTGISPAKAEHFCLFEGGRLPTSDQWLYAAAGNPARRFPWGNTGLVCRRAVFGLQTGPCGVGAVGPTLVGTRPDGRTPEGLWDMAGNVAEWTREGKLFQVRGGSYRSKLAGQLKSWAATKASKPSVHIGFRCAYDPSPADLP